MAFEIVAGVGATALVAVTGNEDHTARVTAALLEMKKLDLAQLQRAYDRS